MSAEPFIPKRFVDKLLHKLRCNKAKEYVKSGDIVCDLGCGREGSFLKTIEQKIAQGFGFDFAVDQSFNSSKIKLENADLNAVVPLPDSSIDIAITMAVIEHLDNDKKFTDEIFRILKKDGILVLSTPTKLVDPILKVLGFLGLVDNKQVHDHKKYYNAKQLTKLLEDAGFVEVEIKKFQFGLNQLAICKK